MNAERARAVLDLLTASIESEAPMTRKVIASVPNSNRSYKPDPKSRTAWELLTHLAMSEIWFADSIMNGKFEWGGEPTVPAEFTDPPAVAKWAEQHLGDRLKKLRAMSNENLTRNVEFFGRSGPAVTWLAMMNNHTVHHRGQLAAYLRAAGSKVPAIYGISADENAFG
jgi:uncharacterized damage-inducible protein DinB